MDAQGKSVVMDRQKDEVEQEQEKKKIEKLAKKGIVRRTKEEKRVLRRQREKQRKNKNKKNGDDEDLHFHDLKDDVAFGDVADAPPSLKFKNFEKNHSTKPAAEGKAGLLLHSISEHDGGKVKKIKLSMAQQVASQLLLLLLEAVSFVHSLLQVRVEADRQSVVEQYRKMKAQQLG